MTLQQLEYVLAVDSFRHFARAAEHCGVTQPTLSMMLQKLEDELGVKLFDRTVQPVRPTATGKKVIEQAHRIVYQASLIKDIVSEEEQSLKDTFRLAVLPTIAPYLVPRFFLKFTEKYANHDIRIMEMKTAPVMTALLNGDIDAAIIASQPEKPELAGETLFYEEFFGYVSRNEPLFKNDVVRSADVNGNRLWLLDEGHCFRDQLLRFCRMEQVKIHQGAYRLGSLETFMRMVESGNGITFIPGLATLQLGAEQRELVRPFAIPKPVREIVFVTHKDFVRRTIAQLLMKSIRKSVPAEMLSLQAFQKLV
ncbi:MAG: hydrogen peroxide-inducible genes activator [Tannerellaceae bacterium]|jgi:LysR family hydrogen peroxide-inducible transcriptional activator|nr:hydrogen peroxide-inducible genes activator [Tannerellaceae bacterium]